MPNKRNTSLTNGVTKAIINLLNCNGFFVFRNNNVPVYDKKLGCHRRGNMLYGVADILGLSPKGQFIAIEVKTGTDKQSIYQERFEQEVKDRDGIYLVASSVDDVMHLISGRK